MAKKYGGRIRRTGRSTMKYKKSGQALAVKSNPYRVARIGLNTYSTRFFPALPNKMNAMIPLFADCRYICPFANSGNDNTSVATCNFFFIDPTNFDRAVANPSTGAVGHQYWFSNIFKPLMGVYSESIIRTSVLKFDMTAEWAKRYGAAATSNAELNGLQTPVVQLAYASVPLGYIRKSTGAQMVINDAGELWTGVDYYAALTQMPGARNVVIPVSGDRPSVKGQLKIDGYDHDGAAMVIRSDVTWNPTAGSSPSITVGWPSDTRQRNVFLFAIRACGLKFANIPQEIVARFCFKLEEHLTFQDSIPPMPLVTQGVA